MSDEASRRHRATEIENALIDEWVAGRFSRRDFLRAGLTLGMSMAALEAFAGAAPERRAATAAPLGPQRTLRVGLAVPAGAINPLTIADTGGCCMLSQIGEFLSVSTPSIGLTPQLALSWKPNTDGSVWTFKIRQGVRFHDGQPMSAVDVAASIDRLADPANGSVALSAFNGVLSKGASRALDEQTVEFRLDAPNGNFPFLVSSDNFNAVILPANYAGDFDRRFVGTGPFRLERYTPRARASFVRNEDYWGGRAPLPRTEFIFYDSIQAQVLAMQGGQLDMLLHVPVQGSQALLADRELRIFSLKSSAHQQLHMRTDRRPFSDKRVRRALALCLNRPNLVTGLFGGRADLGNDSPLAPIFESTDPNVAQRAEDIGAAKSLLAQAGYAQGFAATLSAERFVEIPDYAVVVQNAAKRLGIDLRLNIEDQSAYFGRARFGESDWLDSSMGIEDYGHRGVPNTLLSATLGSAGPFNAAHFRNPAYDRLLADYVAALEPALQRRAAGQIQRLLLEETPIIVAYFCHWLSVMRMDLRATQATASGQLFLGRAYFG